MDHFQVKFKTADEYIHKIYDVEQVQSGLYFNLKIEGIENQTFQFRAKSKSKAEKWVNEIKLHIKYSEGKKHKRSAEGLEFPWIYDNIGEN